MEEILEELTFLLEDDDVPRNVRERVEKAIAFLKEKDSEQGLRANKALQQLDTLTEDPNIPSYLRPQIWNIVSQLETL